MPLPPALAARLARRGLLDKSDESKENDGEEAEEEVFVEHYDEDAHEEPMPMEENIEKRPDPTPYRLVHEKQACPNQANPYHKCTPYCVEKWGYCRFEPDRDMEQKKDKMLVKYPLPVDWEEVGDPVSHRYYYWNSQTGDVSWLPPLHPRSHITLPAAKRQAPLPIVVPVLSSIATSDGEESLHMESDSDSVHSDLNTDNFEILERELFRDKKKREKRGRHDKKREEVLDPMDPASYSDIPRGKWSDGLPTQSDAKTGVDHTASGPLFQQRPYPSPGDILRMNAGK